MTLLQRSDYGRIPVKPPIVPIVQNGVTVDGQSFAIDDTIYVNIELTCVDGTKYVLPYESVLVCPNIKTNIFRISAEKLFSSVLRHERLLTLTYTPFESDRSVTVQCYNETATPTHAYIEIAKATIVPDNTTTFIEGIVRGRNRANPFRSALIESDGGDGNEVGVESIYVDNPARRVKLPFRNDSGDNISLKRGARIAEVFEMVP